MKNRIMIMVIVGMMMVGTSAYAGSMEVSLIGGEDEGNTDPVSMDDIKIDQDIEIDNYGIITPKEYKTIDTLRAYNAGHRDYNNMHDFKSGDTADYVILNIDITNTLTRSKSYLDNCSVKVTFNGKYEYEGWAYQYNYDNEGEQSKECPVDPSDQFSIDPMYEGHYVFGCTLPNKVVNGKEPLNMTIVLDGNELTYRIRK